MRRVLEKVETPWNRVEVVEQDGDVLMEAAGAIYAAYHPERPFSGYYWDALAAAVLLHRRCGEDGRDLRVLMIGLGGATAFHAIRGMLLGCELVAAEADARMVEVARRHFALDATGATVIVCDGYEHALQNPGAYDVILDDAFVADAWDTRRLRVDGALLAGLAGALRDDGLLAVNLFAGKSDDELLPFKRVFRDVIDLVPPAGANVVRCGARGATRDSDVGPHIARLPEDARDAARALEWRFC